jgi:hypothetical protein
VPKSVLAVSALATMLMAVPVRAQTYDPAYPVCIHVYGDLEGDRIDCIFTSLPQCQASAFGRPATCLINPYFAEVPRRTRRSR